MSEVMELVKNQSRDAMLWARAFVEVIKTTPTVKNYRPELDEGYMVGWFANAMMAMHDSIYNNEIAKLKAENEKLKQRQLRVTNYSKFRDASHESKT